MAILKPHNSAVSDQLIASGTAGAIATLAHDSLMTPFDGKLKQSREKCGGGIFLTNKGYSDQAKNAVA
jgi:hypothetical protein